MPKYLQVIRNTFQDYFTYRLNFIMWRVRSVIRLLAVYFLWWAVFRQDQQLFGYDQKLILTYVLGTSLIRALVLASRSVDVGGQIASGELNNYLLKPINYFYHWFAKDLADKLLNLGFVVVEISAIIWLLKPPLFLQTNLLYLLGFLVTVLLAMMLYFSLSFLISLTTFWYVEHGGWPARFLFETTLDFFSGGLFPLDILPLPVFAFFKLLPSAYLLFFPLQVYLGRLDYLAVLSGWLIMLFWWLVLSLLVKLVWQKGIRGYEAYGH